MGVIILVYLCFTYAPMVLLAFAAVSLSNLVGMINWLNLMFLLFFCFFVWVKSTALCYEFQYELFTYHTLFVTVLNEYLVVDVGHFLFLLVCFYFDSMIYLNVFVYFWWFKNDSHFLIAILCKKRFYSFDVLLCKSYCLFTFISFILLRSRGYWGIFMLKSVWGWFRNFDYEIMYAITTLFIVKGGSRI